PNILSPHGQKEISASTRNSQPLDCAVRASPIGHCTTLWGSTMEARNSDPCATHIPEPGLKKVRCFSEFSHLPHWLLSLVISGSLLLCRKSYESLCNMYTKIEPLLETEHRDFTEVQNFIQSDVQRLYIKDAQGNSLVDKKQLEKILLLNYVCNLNAEYQQGFHEMLLLFRLLVEKEHEIYWLFQFFLQKTENSCIINVGVQKNLVILKALIAFMDPIFAKHLESKGEVVLSLFPWFCLFFQRVFKSFEDVWRMWEVFLTGHPCKNFQVIIAYTMLQMLMLSSVFFNQLCHSIVDLDADDLIARACNIYELFLKHEDKVKNSTVVPCNGDLEGMILMISHARSVNL
uniref:TBC1 domain family member 21 n=1 Tax=Naja naja TaxID=35670 RepID=A0A8C6Y2K9_NAJNA